jgi:hypothetical protein
MLPTRVVLMESLPLNANGKVDRSALPPPDWPEPDGAPPARPATEWERTIAALCARILRRPVGADENYFDAGATSLDLIELHAEIAKTFHPGLTISELFECATVRALARRLDGHADRATALSEVQRRASQQRGAFTRHKRLRGVGNE